MTTDTSERGLERLICTVLTGSPCDPRQPTTGSDSDAAAPSGGVGWTCGQPSDYDREHTVELAHLRAFLSETQPDTFEGLRIEDDGPALRKFLARLQSEVSKRGVIDVLRNGIKHGPHHVELFYGTPSSDNPKAVENYARNRFSVTRQLRYSLDEKQRALDLCLFINGLPITTFELKNSLTKQTVEDAVQQYKRDRSPREKLFEFGRCVAHFAVDDNEVRFCTHLKGKDSWFLPFNRGWDDGAGNPPNPDGLKTDYLWKQILTRDGLTEILENYALRVDTKDQKTGKRSRVQIWPRYHQLEVVRRLLADARQQGVGRRYLIQHSAGSGKSNSIAWLAHQLIGLEKGDKRVFDSIIVVTDRKLLDKQIRDTIKQFAQVGATVGHAERSADLRSMIESGKKIIISTVQKFPFILDEIGGQHRKRRFAIIVDEAHSSQGGKASAAMSTALSEAGEREVDETAEDQINRIMEARKLLRNASYFAFTATPKNKTLEIFGEPYDENGQTKHRPFHSYTMKQAIQEGFILDVLGSYTPVKSYYRLVKRIEDDPEFDTKRARKKLRNYVEGHGHAIGLKAEIMVDHFHEQVLSRRKVGGEARAMVVTRSIRGAVQYYHAIRQYLLDRKSSYQAIVAFSGEHEYGGAPVTESSLNGFPSSQIASKIQQHPYRILVCAEKFQTGYDEPLMHTMYVDKDLSGIKAVQTLSRLNRAHPKKHDVFVLDFVNKTDMIEDAFSDYYQTTILSEETDPNKLHDLKAALDGYQIYSDGEIDEFVSSFLEKAGRERLDPMLDTCVAAYIQGLDEDGQVDFKGKAKAFVRTYGFLSAVLPYSLREWEKLSIYLNFLIPKLPAPEEPDLSKGILESIDMDSYRVEKKATENILLSEEDAEIDPVTITGGGHTSEPELDILSNIIKAFNDLFGNIPWENADRVQRLVTEEIPQGVAKDPAYRNAKANSDEQNARVEHDAALGRVMMSVLKDDTQLYKEFADNEDFKRWMTETSFRLTYQQPPPEDGATDSV